MFVTYFVMFVSVIYLFFIAIVFIFKFCLLAKLKPFLVLNPC